jgi:hypothetical protein
MTYDGYYRTHFCAFQLPVGSVPKPLKNNGVGENPRKNGQKREQGGW